ncbi:MAG: EAL domain-containing protein [Gammaproteobacteria bacterium]|nr:EAL domain-containing protein [Gammaproteobacteria bacterium]MBU1603297.1 EAL domain-containing protein [Gammaproteobacteria bacterium]MBU2432817.1 EAL domain-containing protein [Gammaproteobacteria bacterium]MBU2450060.1 EAL domain-containing protein [Gammaproteobacteria bacterium]
MTTGVGGKSVVLEEAGKGKGKGGLPALTEQESMFRTTMEAAQVGIFVLQDGRFKYVNPYLTRLFGYSAEEMIDGMGPLDVVAPELHAFIVDQMRARAAGASGHYYEISAVRKDGSVFPAMVYGAPSSFDGRPASVGTLLDISAQKAAESRIRELADYDVLTGLPNRRLLRERFVLLLAAAERDKSEIAVIFLDLDHFKRVNDSLGHSVGDELLVEVARRLDTVVRRIDTVARLGGDEFIFAMPGFHTAAAAEVARRIIDVFARPFEVAGHELTVTPSLGISIYPHDGEDLETLLKNADTAMYRAKEIGRNTFQFYATEMNTATLDRLLMESNLRRALAQGEFILQYQPLVNLRSGLVIGVEALIRWQHPELGTIMPDNFIHVAEETGLINPIGDWVLCEACRQAKAWCDEGLPSLVVAVNVAPVQFRQPGFVEMVAGALAASGLEAGLLELELTERTVMHDADINLGTLSALHRMGVELSLDDFGTGYSSLAYLKRFPVGKLKIDRSFVNDLETDPDDWAIASTIVSMGRSLRMTVLAEGVETAEQLAQLRKMGCDMAQGYYFSRPTSAAGIAEILRQQPFVNR